MAKPNPFNPISSIFPGYDEPTATPYEKEVTYPDFEDVLKNLKKGRELQQPELMSAYPSLKTEDMTQKPTPTEEQPKDSGGISQQVGSELIKAGGKTLATAAEQSAAWEQLKSKVSQESALQAGKAQRQAISRGSKAAQRSLAELMASFRASTK